VEKEYESRVETLEEFVKKGESDENHLEKVGYDDKPVSDKVML